MSDFKVGKTRVSLLRSCARWLSSTPSAWESGGPGNPSIKMSPAPLAEEATGRNPTDRGKQGSKVHLLVDERGAPLALHVTGANEHDRWSADDLILTLVVERPDPTEVEPHFCADKGYDYDDVHTAVEQAGYIPHIKFDVVVCPLVMHYLKEWQPVFREFHRILKPRGI